MIGVGTFGCGSVIVEGEDFIAENITFENSAPEVTLDSFFFFFLFFFIFLPFPALLLIFFFFNFFILEARE